MVMLMMTCVCSQKYVDKVINNELTVNKKVIKLVIRVKKEVYLCVYIYISV